MRCKAAARNSTGRDTKGPRMGLSASGRAQKKGSNAGRTAEGISETRPALGWDGMGWDGMGWDGAGRGGGGWDGE